MQLSKNFTLEEFVQSQTASRLNLDNTPGQQEIRNIKYLVDNVLQPVRNYFGRPVIITSGYRSLAVNRAIGSRDTSQHPKGQAADFYIPGLPLKDSMVYIRDYLLFDQLIHEFNSWCHVSYDIARNRKMLLTINHSGVKNGLPF